MKAQIQSSIGLQSLYDHFYFLLKAYLEPRYYLKLMNTCKIQFAELKKSTVHYVLNSKWTGRFFKNLNFRNKVLDLVVSLHHQVSFRAEIDFSMVGFKINTNELNLIDSTHLSKMYDYRDLYLPSEFFSARTFPSDSMVFNGIVEISLFCISTPINCTLLKNCRILLITECSGVTDVSPLHNIFDLRLSECFKVEDLSPLINNTYLSIDGCSGVKKTSTFQNVRYLTLRAPNIPQIHELEEIPCPFITLYGYTSTGWNISNPRRKSLTFVQNSTFSTSLTISFLSSLFSVTFNRCNSLADISCLSQVPYIRVCSCPALQSLQGLNPKLLKKIVIQDCDRIVSFIEIDGCEEVEIDRCPKFKDPSQLQNVKKLTIRCCPIPAEVPYLGNILSLKIVECRLRSVTGLSNVPIIEIRDCRTIKDLHLLQNNQKITFDKTMMQAFDFSFLERNYVQEEIDFSLTVFLRKLP